MLGKKNKKFGGRFLLPILQLFSSVRFGVLLLALLFVYSAIGSSGVPTTIKIWEPASWLSVRSMPHFEMTEMEWFSWWPFSFLIFLLCATLTTTTLRRIPLSRLTLGSWTIHTGIIFMSLSSVWYFATKLEGDVLIPRRVISITVPGSSGSMVSSLGNTLVLKSDGGEYKFRVLSTDPSWEILTGEHSGKKVYSVQLSIETPTDFFVRQIIDEHPEYTEDLIVTGNQQSPLKRAQKEINKKIIDENVVTDTKPMFKNKFFLTQSSALYLREIVNGIAQDWKEYPIKNLPRYNDYVLNYANIWDPGFELTTKPIEIGVVKKSDFPGGIKATGYLRYAVNESRWSSGGQTEYPVIFTDIRTNDGRKQSYELVVNEPGLSTADPEILTVVKIKDTQEIKTIQSGGFGGLTAFFGDQKEMIPLGESKVWRLVENTNLCWRLVSTEDNLRIGNKSTSIARVEMKEVPFVACKVDEVFTQIPVFEGSNQIIETKGGTWDLTVISVQKNWELLTGSKKGQKTTAINVRIKSPKDSFTRQLLLGFPGFTEDVVDTGNPQKPFARAIKELGRALVSEKISFDLDPNTVFTKPWERWVFEDDSVNRDVKEKDAAHSRNIVSDKTDTDDRVTFKYYPKKLSPITVLYGPNEGEIRVVLALDKKSTEVIDVDGNNPIVIDTGVTMSFSKVLHRAINESKPRLVPPIQRRPDVENQASMVELTLGDKQVFWIPYHHFVFNNESSVIKPFLYQPKRVSTTEGRMFDLIFSREQRQLPNPISLTRFDMETHVGGYSGSSASVLNWMSSILFGSGKDGVVRVNDPQEDEGFWFFQAQWDPPQTSPGGSGGLNYTVLGVGNRNGVWGMLFGSVLSVFGMIWAFYIKPFVKKSIINKRIKTKITTVLFLFLFLNQTTYSQVQNISEESIEKEESFFKNINVEPLESGVAVWKDGRLRSMGSHAKEWIGFVTGGKKIDKKSPLYTMLDVTFRPNFYEDKDIIYVKNKQVRVSIINGLKVSFGVDNPEEYFRVFLKTGFISPQKIKDKLVQSELSKLRSDVLRFDKPVSQIEQALSAINSNRIRFSFSVLPPKNNQQDTRWFSLDELGFDTNQQTDSEKLILSAWKLLEQKWQDRDVVACNELIENISLMVYQSGSKHSAYPSQIKLTLENFYFKYRNLTDIWLGYLFTIVVLLVGVVYRWEKIIKIGFILFIAVFFVHTCTLGWRWYISGRWPNTNMFEAITTAAWFGGVFSVLIEFMLRRTTMFGVFALSSSVASMFALMSTALFPIQLNSSISNRMPVLHDVWLYIHTNVIIFSYCLIFFGSITSFLYVLWRFRNFVLYKSKIKTNKTYATVGGLESVGILKNENSVNIFNMGQVLDATTMILVELSFILLWAGIIMGAIWADHSWGRPWGWDPKEVFALNTFLIFALLIHIRMKALDKGLWTAFLSMVGCVVMIFNWVIINFAISGLHSYA